MFEKLAPEAAVVAFNERYHIGSRLWFGAELITKDLARVADGVAVVDV